MHGSSVGAVEGCGRVSRRTRTYVSHSITGSGDWKQNVKQIQRIGMELRRRGYAPFVPAVAPASAIGRGMTHEDWLECDFPYVQVADVVLRVAGVSPGADAEVAYAQEIGVPVFEADDPPDFDVFAAAVPPRQYGDERFHNLLYSLGRLHDRKQADYGSDGDPFANVRASEDFGVRPWVGALVRLNDKVTRLKNFARTGTLSNEGAVDSMLDISVYALIGKILLDEETGT